MARPFFRIIAASIKRFNDDKCWTSAIVISYFAFLCAIPLLSLFAYISAKVLGSSELVFRGLNIFNEEFFAHLDPAFFQKLQGLGDQLGNLGWFGLAGGVRSAGLPVLVSRLA